MAGDQEAETIFGARHMGISSVISGCMPMTVLLTNRVEKKNGHASIWVGPVKRMGMSSPTPSAEVTPN
jgi:hypothetical protein